MENGLALFFLPKTKSSFIFQKALHMVFLVLSEEAEFVYKCDELYHPEDEGGLAWDDQSVGIHWPISENMEVLLSEKDKVHPGLGDFSFEI